jgi:predicted RNase H-like HicB family nuclease
MRKHFIISDYIEGALERAVYDKLEDGSFSGRIPLCTGVIAFGSNLRDCESELRSTLEDWIFVGLKMNHELPVIEGIDLNKEPTRDAVGTL